MEARRVAEQRVWDHLRVQDVHVSTGRAVYGKAADSLDKMRSQNTSMRSTEYAYRVITGISQHVLQCKCVKHLLPHLVRREVMANSASLVILSQSDSEAPRSLEKLLRGRSREPGIDVQQMVEGIYLALLDCYEESGNVWCHSMAVSGLHRVVRLELKLPNINYYDLANIVQRVLPTNLPQGDADRLNDELGLSQYRPLNDLKKIIHVALSIRVTFRKLASALLLTRYTGRYLSLLLPYCHSNPPCVYEVVQRLGHFWTELAVYLGYSEVEIGAVARAGGEDLCRQIQMFLRVWWMPDCGPERTVALLNQLIVEKLDIDKPVHVKDTGHGLLIACLDGDWGKAEGLIKSGSYLDAVTEDGKTPLMLACLKMKEQVVQLLINYGADVQAKDKKGEACLNYTETLQNRAILELIVKEYWKLGASVDIESKETGCSPLSTACKCGAVASAELLLEYGANPNGCKNGRHRPLVEASSQGHVGLVNTLLRFKADVNATTKTGYTALLEACTKKYWYLAQVLMNEGADVNKCTPEGTSPLFVAVEADEYVTASELIKKGAFVNGVKFQSGSMEGIVEFTPLAQAAVKGLNKMVELLINSGANINFLCSDTMPAIGFAIIGDHINTFHLFLRSPNLDKSLSGLTAAIITSVKTEKYYFTEKLLETFGGPKVAVMQAQQHDHMKQLVDNIVMYMQAVNHCDLPRVLQELDHGVLQATPASPYRQPPLSPREIDKINSVLTSFCRICVSAIFNSSDINVSQVIEVAQATGNAPVAIFLNQALPGSMTDQELRHNFLLGEPSPLRFLIENKVLTMDIFMDEVLKFHPTDSENYLKDLMNGGADLPTDVYAMLNHLFSGKFTPRTIPPGGMYSEDLEKTEHTSEADLEKTEHTSEADLEKTEHTSEADLEKIEHTSEADLEMTEHTSEISVDESFSAYLEEAMKNGYVEVKLVKMIVVGPAGVGKTCLIYLLLSRPPPEERNSTGCAERSIRVIRIGKEGEEWCEISTKEFTKMIAEAVPLLYDELKTETKEEPSQKQENGDYTLNESAKPRVDTERESYNPHEDEGEGCLGKSFMTGVMDQSSSEPDTKNLEQVIDDVIKKITMLVSKGNTSPRLLEMEMIYLTDSGGQQAYWDLAPIFTYDTSATIFVHRLCEELGEHPLNDLYKSGKRVGPEQRARLTTAQAFKTVLQGLEKTGKRSKIIVVGTHKDLANECDETADDKNKSLVHIASPHFEDDVVYCNEGMNDVIFQINAKTPNDEDKKELGKIRSSVQDLAVVHKIPIWWFILQQILEALAEKKGRKVLTKKECANIADSLGFSEEKLDAALAFLDKLNIFLYKKDILPNVVLTDAQIPLDKLSTLVEKQHHLQVAGNNPEKAADVATTGCKSFRDKGILTLEFLKEFKKHYVDEIFTAEDFLTLIESLLIVSKLSEKEYFFPAILNSTEEPQILEYLHASKCSAVAPLVVQFRTGWAPPGVYCCSACHLQSKSGWEIAKHPHIPTRNCIKLIKRGRPGSVTFIDMFSCFVVCVNLNTCGMTPAKLYKLCKNIKSEIFTAVEAALENTHHIDSEHKDPKKLPFPAFFCPRQDKSCSTKIHIADVSDDGKDWVCNHNCEVFATLTTNQSPWFGDPGTTLSERVRTLKLQRVLPEPGQQSHTKEKDSQVRKERPTLCLDKDDLFDVVSECEGVTARWKHIGLALRLVPFRLNVIEKEHKDFSTCLTEVLTLWLNKTYNTDKFGEPSWELLARAVGHSSGGNNPALAEEIIRKHGSSN